VILADTLALNTISSDSVLASLIVFQVYTFCVLG
jgi:hypothetical protein